MADASTNALAGEESAYLRQHADQPVHWQPFGDAAFAVAREREVPIFLSIGYAACHWCHVMAHESFDDPALADYLNEHFLPVKVDREERPDVDAVYMAATQAISGQGGWPMSVFLTPDGQAFHAGTYFPPRSLHGRPSFLEVLMAVQEAWQERRAEVYKSARQLALALTGQPLVLGSVLRLDHTGDAAVQPLIDAAVHKLAEEEDPDDAGFGRAPKFPPSSVLGFLIRVAAQANPTEASPTESGATAALARSMAARVLATMADSALQDQLAGGFARYSVTADWSLPHYEKMLYDNAQLLRRYAEWAKLPSGEDFPRDLALRVVRQTADFMLESLRRHDGAFASSLDADSLAEVAGPEVAGPEVAGQLHEGAAYTWTRESLVQVLGPTDGTRLAGLMNVADEQAPLHPGRRFDAQERAFVDSLRAPLLEARLRRPQPAVDEKAVAGWNGLAIGSLVEAWAVSAQQRYLDAALHAARVLRATHWRNGVLRRVGAEGQPGLLEDYVWCAEAFFLLFSATGDASWYLLGEDLLLAACASFVHDGRVVDTVSNSAELLNAQGGVQGAEPMDNATPSGIAGFAEVLVRYAALSGSIEHRELAEKILDRLGPLSNRVPRAMGSALGTLVAVAEGPWEVAVVGQRGAAELSQAAWLSPSPGLVIASSTGASSTGLERTESAQVPEVPLPEVPLLAGRTAGRDGSALAYLCKGMVCQRPTSDPAVLTAELAATRA